MIDNRGMTLVEILVAMLLLTVALFGLVCLFSSGFSLTRRSDDVGVAYNIAREEIEHARNMGFDHLPRAHTWLFGYNYDEATGAWQKTVEANPHFAATVIADPGFSDPAAMPAYPLRTVRVEVRSVEDNEMLFYTETYLTQGGI